MRGGALLDAILFQTGLVLVAALLAMTTVLPNARKAARAEEAAARMEAEVEALADRVTRLRREIRSLQTDPPYIERMLKRRLKELRPHEYAPPPLPAASFDGAQDERSGG